jgi:dihydrofolate reductase
MFIATSLDSFISREDGSIDWLEEANTRVPAGEDCGYAEFMSTVDALVMGRHTFDLASSFADRCRRMCVSSTYRHVLSTSNSCKPSTASSRRSGPRLP